MVYQDALCVIIPVPLIDKSQWLMVYKIYNFKLSTISKILLCNNTPFYPLDSTIHCSYFLLQTNLNKIEQYCSLSVPNQTTNQAVTLIYYYWAIMMMIPNKLQAMCLTSSYYIKLKILVDMIFLFDVCEAYTNTFYLPARNSLSKEVDSKRNDSKLTNFTLKYKDIYDFALIKGLQITNLTTDELTELATEIPKMQEVTIHSLNTKLKEINKNYYL